MEIKIPWLERFEQQHPDNEENQGEPDIDFLTMVMELEYR